jgi:gliding motility-associated-like protein
MHKPILLFSLLLFNLGAFAQNEANVWYFGINAGIDFNGSQPVALSDGALSTREGCASICDSSGSLLFYTDGISVFNKNHKLMSNGANLMGHNSSTQSAIIVRKPGSAKIYYVFTVDRQAFPNGLRYSEVDISLQGGLGDVNSNKNIKVVTPTCEKITAITHQNGKDFWILTHLPSSNHFHSYLLTDTGLSKTPVVSKIGITLTTGTTGTLGYLKASVDGTRVVAAHFADDIFEVFYFDNSNGQLSNPITFKNCPDPYGAEFSPNGKRLYVVAYAPYTLYQYNLDAGSPSDIINSQVNIDSTLYGGGGALQLAPDGKIYCTRETLGYLGVINAPDSLGKDCNHVRSGIKLAGKIAALGLPTFFNSINTFNSSNFKYAQTCFGDSTEFYIESSKVDSVFWTFGDSSSGTKNFSTKMNPKHLFSDSGTYAVRLISYSDSLSDTTVRMIRILRISGVKIEVIGIPCVGDTVILKAGNPPVTSLSWQDGSRDSQFHVTHGGMYWVDIMEKNCKVRDSIYIDYSPIPIFNLGNDTVLCQGDTLTLTVRTMNTTYRWSDSSKNDFLKVTKTGYHWVEVTLDKCSSIDSIHAEFTPLPVFNLGKDTSLCEKDILTLKANVPNASYDWSDGSDKDSINVTQSGLYLVEVTVGNCSKKDSIHVTYKPLPVFSLPEDTSLCDGDMLTLKATVPNASYEWNDGSKKDSLNVNTSGIYWVEVSLDICSKTDSIKVEFKPLPVFDLGLDTSLCDGEILTLSTFTSNSTYKWNNGSEKDSLNVSKTGLYWVEVSLDKCSKKDSIHVTFKPLPVFNLGEDTSLCDGDTITLSASVNDGSYNWNDGSNSSDYKVGKVGIYILTIEKDNCFASDSVIISKKICSQVLFMPNVFTPNGDRLNQLFLPIQAENINGVLISIYNRWGDRVYEDNVLKGWDGTVGEKPVAAGTYFWLVKLKDDAGQLSGIVTLIR